MFHFHFASHIYSGDITDNCGSASLPFFAAVRTPGSSSALTALGTSRKYHQYFRHQAREKKAGRQT